jgi:hypothetical protein
MVALWSVEFDCCFSPPFGATLQKNHSRGPLGSNENGPCPGSRIAAEKWARHGNHGEPSVPLSNTTQSTSLADSADYYLFCGGAAVVGGYGPVFALYEVG